MSPEKTYYVRFEFRHDSEIAEKDYTKPEAAWKTFRMYVGPESAELFTRIVLTEYSWKTRECRLLASLDFGPEFSKEGQPGEELQENEDDLPEYEERYIPSATAGDYGPGNPWNAPGMSIHDFI